jgi:hypothetical protein
VVAVDEKVEDLFPDFGLVPTSSASVLSAVPVAGGMEIRVFVPAVRHGR